MSHVSRRQRVQAAAVVAGKEVLRDPVLLGLLAFLPVYFIGLWGWLVPDDPVRVAVATAEGTVTVETDLVSLMLSLMGPVTAALLVGITGLFLVQRSRDIDERLRVVGFRGAELLVARLCLLAAVAILVVCVSLAVTMIYSVPEHLGWFLFALVVAGATYGGIGVLAGLFIDRMAGVYLLLFIPMFDILLLGLPLGGSPGWADWLPGHHAAELAISAALAERVALSHAGWGLFVVAVISTVAVAVAASQ
ncbi:hypothetical protein [Halovenus salina]|uniref:ABC transporter permease n=1 Tax=Halovenus salina TaxID=1510225 RepID=A0ABD5VYF2_9EURY|nr:hypothetical protein [Halovenus salina]